MRVSGVYAIAPAIVLSGLASGCGDRGAVTFSIKAPANDLFNPVAQSEQVTEFDLRTSSGQVIGIAGAVQGSGSGDGDKGLLPLGALMPVGPEDVFITALSGTNLVGEARIRDVTIKAGKRTTYEAQLRKPLVFVGSALPFESGLGNHATAAQILDPIASVDLTTVGKNPPQVSPGMTSGAVSWDGQYLFNVAGGQLGIFDTGTGANTGGMLALPFAPVRVAVAPRDRVLVALSAAMGSDGQLLLVGDVAGLAKNPAAAQTQTVTLPGQVPRAVAFSNDGNTIYVLTGSYAVDPCGPGTPPAANAIVQVSADGQVGPTYALPGFVSDITVDQSTGLLVLAETTRGQVSTLDPKALGGGGNGPQQVLGRLTCPSAVRVVNGVAFVVTSEHDTTQSNAFVVQRITLSNGQSTALPVGGPTYTVPLDSDPSQNGNIEMLKLFVRPGSLEAYELVLTPDGNLATFATRAHYKETGTTFKLSPVQPCTANFDIVEYGLYTVDVRTGNSSYAMRSQVVVSQLSAGNLDYCLACSAPGSGGEQPAATCDSKPGDRPAGLSAAFGQ
jgi:hypothetical protein